LLAYLHYQVHFICERRKGRKDEGEKPNKIIEKMQKGAEGRKKRK
jgi:hypothetical protein